MQTVTNLEDLRTSARKRVPRAFFDYVESGSYDELTLEANKTDLDAIALDQRVLVGVEERSLESTLLGKKISMPIGIAPTGLIYPNGEIHACKAALGHAQL